MEIARVVGKPAFGNDCEWNQMKCDSENATMFCHYGFWRYKEVCKGSDVCKSISDMNAKCVKVNRPMGTPVFDREIPGFPNDKIVK